MATQVKLYIETILDGDTWDLDGVEAPIVTTDLYPRPSLFGEIAASLGLDNGVGAMLETESGKMFAITVTSMVVGCSVLYFTESMLYFLLITLPIFLLMCNTDNKIVRGFLQLD